MIELPLSSEKGDKFRLTKLLVYSHPKVGKTDNFLKLPNALLIDLEGGAATFDGQKIDVKKIALEKGIGMLDVLQQIIQAIKAHYEEHGKSPYDYIIIDPLTVLEEEAKTLATLKYKKSAVGTNFKGTDVVTELEYGLGYVFLRDAMKTIYSSFEGLANECLILLGHVKSSSIKKDGKELSARDINLTGKNKILLCTDVDAVGYMYRAPMKKGETISKNILSFKTSYDDLATGSRPAHLSNTEFVFSEYDLEKRQTIQVNIDKLFPNIKQPYKV